MPTISKGSRRLMRDINQSLLLNLIQAQNPISRADLARESGVKLIACQMTLDVLGVEQKDLIDGIELGGLATFLEYGMGASVTLFV